MRFVLIYLIGVIFGTGIVLSGMANPAKVINFFDIAGTWDPSLAFVMGGALITTAIGYRLVLGRARPIFDGRSFSSSPSRKRCVSPSPQNRASRSKPSSDFGKVWVCASSIICRRCSISR
jgi:uncharacterized membrane protein YedE/YeeE